METTLVVGIVLIALSAILTTVLLSALVRKHVVTSSYAEDRIGDCRNELWDRTTDRNGWRDLCSDLVRRMERQEATNALLVEHLRSLSDKENLDVTGDTQGKP